MFYLNRQARDNKRRKRAFTLMELMIVLLILGMLAALITPNFMRRVEQAKHRTAQLQISLLSNAVQDYYLDMGVYPERLDQLIENPGHPRWSGPYLEPPQIPKDPWDEPYHYRYPGQHGRFDIFSYGANKTPGGDQFEADIGNW